MAEGNTTETDHREMTERRHPRRADLDARSIVPVTDDIGGVVLYVAGEPAYYVLNGEWFEALAGIGAAWRSDQGRQRPTVSRILVGYE